MKKYGFYYGALFSVPKKSWAILPPLSEAIKIDENCIRVTPLKISSSFVEHNISLTYKDLKNGPWYFMIKDIIWYDDMDTLLQDNFDKLLE